MMNKSWYLLIGIGFWIGLMVSFVVVNLVSPENTAPYKKGQIDVINGKVLFELKKKDDGSTEWVKK